MVFDENSYKDYLKKILTSTGEGRGLRSQLAKFLNCQTGYISQVLNGEVHFSFEHALLVTKFLKMSSDERDFFILLVSKDKAGTKDLSDHYLEKIREVREKRSQIKERIKVKGALSKEDQVTYYSQWYFSAIHIAVMIESLRTKEEISIRFNLDQGLVQEVLDFLESNKLIESEGNRYKIGQSRIHLDRKSPLIIKHHTNWRIESIKALEKKSNENLHYSSVVTLSAKDAKRIKEMMLKSLEEIEQVLGPSPEEEIYSIDMDFFRL